MSTLKSNKVNKSRVGKPRPPTQDRAHDVLRSEGYPLDTIFMPHSVAVIGPLTVRAVWDEPCYGAW